MRVLEAGFLVLALSGALAGCTSSSEKREKETHRLNQIAVETLRFRRPDRPLFEREKAELNPHLLRSPEDGEYQTHDCELPESVLASALNLTEVESCLTSVTAVTTLRYRLEWDEKNPAYQLKAPEQAPPCIQQSLKRIPVPREVVYQDLAGCYAQRLNPKSKLDLKVTFPLENLDADPQATSRLILGWIMGAFYDAKLRAFPAFYLPGRFCDRCSPGVRAHPRSQWWPPPFG